MKRKSLAGQLGSFVVSVLIIAIGVTGFFWLMRKPEEQVSAKTAPLPPLIHTAEIRAHEGTLDIVVDGVVSPFREIEVAAEVAGKVVFKDESCQSGSFVRRGKILMKIDPRDYQLAIDRLNTQLEQADANLAELKVEISNTDDLIQVSEKQVELEENEVGRLAGLIQQRIVTDSSLDRAKLLELSARNSLVQLKNQRLLLQTRERRLQSARDLVLNDLEKAQLDLERTEITAAADGVVLNDLVEKDSFVQAGTKLFTLEDTSAVEVRCRLRMEKLYWVWRQAGSEPTNLADASSGYQLPRTPVTVSYHLADRSDVSYEWQGVLAHYDGIGLDETTRTVPCRILVDQPRKVRAVSQRASPVKFEGPPALVRGMFVTVTIHVDQPSPLLLIPERAVQPGKQVWVVREGRLEQIRSLDLIELFRTTSADGGTESFWLVEADVSGLASGDRVVVPPFGNLTAGMQVRETDSP